MRFWLAVFCLLAAPATAQRQLDCNATDGTAIEQSLEEAKALTLRAAVAVGPNAQFEKWFGPYTRRNAEDVRAALKAVYNAMKSGAVRTRCQTLSNDTCATGAYAFVQPTIPFEVHICPLFFELPIVSGLELGRTGSEYGSRSGTIIHELSHFRIAADTEDHCYGRGPCRSMAQDMPRLAVKNADSYQYFAEDVALLQRSGRETKPPAVSRAVGD